MRAEALKREGNIIYTEKKCIALFTALALLLICLSDAAVAAPVDWSAPWPSSVSARVGVLNPNSSLRHDTWQNNGYAIDFLMPSGTPLYAPADGVVVCAAQALNIFAGDSCARGHGAVDGNGAYGLHVRLRCDGYEVILAHASSISVGSGQSVRRGDLIGYSGSSGASTAPHVHVEVLGQRGNALSIFGKPSSFFVAGATLSGGIGGGSQPTPGAPDPGTQPEPTPNRPSGSVGFFNAEAGPTLDQWNYYREIGNANKATEMGFPNDELSCVEIFAENLAVELFTDDHHQGKSVKLEGRGRFDLRNYDVNNMVSSYKVYDRNQGPVADAPSPAPQPSERYEVRGVARDAASATVTVADSRGATTSISCWRGPDGCFQVRLPDHTSWTLTPESGIDILDADPSFASGNGERVGGALRFRAGQSVTFGQHGSASVSCSFWLKTADGAPAATPPAAPSQPSGRYEVRGLVRDAASATVTVADSRGETTSILCRRGPDGCFQVRLPDHTSWTLTPEFGVDILDADPSFASGNGERVGGALRFRAGQSVTFGQHGSASVSCSFWLKTADGAPAGGAPSDDAPSDTTPPAPDPAGPTPPTIQLPSIAGGGCNAGFSGLCVLLALTGAFFGRKR